MLKEEKLRTIVLSVFVLFVIALLLIFVKFDITGRTVFFEKNDFATNEVVKGMLNLKLREGELLPSSTRVVATLGEATKEMSLKEFVDASGLSLEEQHGAFYFDDKELSGEGFGYGFEGHYMVYPEISFKLNIGQAEVNSENGEEEIESVGETAEENNETNSTSTEGAEENQETQNPLTGFIISLFKRFGIWDGFAVLEENANGKIIEATCSAEKIFSYELGEGESADLIVGSVRVQDKKIDDDSVRLEIKDNILEASTEYFESFSGFGESYLGEEKDFNLELGALGLRAEQPGTYTLTVKFIYQGQELLQESQDVTISPAEITIKVVDSEGNIQDEITSNEPRIKLKIGKVKVGNRVENNLQVENIEQEGVTGGVIMENPVSLPESEINFIAVPPETIIQIDQPTDAQKSQGALTEIFAIEPSQEIEIESATITLEKISTMPIARILQCDDWSIDDFACLSSWKDSGLEFLDNGTHISFNPKHFTAYLGTGNMTCPYYANESVVLVEDVQCNGTAFIINNASITIDCQGNTINYSVNSAGYAIDNSGGFDNVTIRNCVIEQINVSQANSNAIYFNNVENSTIEGNIITINSNSRGINFYQGSNHNTIDNNDIVVPTTGNVMGVCSTGSACNNNTVTDNIFTGGAYLYFSGNSDIVANNSLYNITEIEFDGDHNFFAHNYIEDSITGSRDGTVYCNAEGDINNTFFNNTIITSGDDENNGIWIEYCNQTNISNNNITTNCKGCKGIYLEYPSTTYVDYNNIITYGNATTAATPVYSYGIHINYVADDFKYIRNNNIETSGVGATGIYLQNTETYTPESRNIFRDNVITTAKGYGFDISADCYSPGGGGAEPSDIDSSNLVEGKPVYYYCNVSNTLVEDLDAGQIIVGYSYDVDPSDLTFRNVSSEDGILLAEGVVGVLIEDSNIDTNNQEGVAGVYMKYTSSSNVSESILNNNYYGVYDVNGNNRIEENNFTNNEYGVVARLCDSDVVFSNVMDANTVHVLLDATSGGGGGPGSLHNVSFNNISGGDYGIYLSDEDNCDVEGNTLDDVDYAIYIASPGEALLESGSNDFTNNEITNSGIYDFYIEYADDPASGYDSVTNLSVDDMRTSFNAWNIALKSATSPATDPDGYQNISKYLNISNTTEDLSGTFLCAGEALDCGNFFEEECPGQQGCSWNVGGWCEGTHSTCDTYNDSYCETQQNCVLGVPSSPWITLNISYNESELGDVNESTLAMWEYSGDPPVFGTWSIIDGSNVSTAGNYVYVNISNFSIFAPMGEAGGGDTSAPNYSQDDDNSGGSVRQGTNVNVYVYWEDDVELSQAVFRTNDSGTWTNVSTCDMAGNSGWCNNTINTAGDAGKIICWNQWANDSSDQWNTTMSNIEHCFNVRTSGGGGGGGVEPVEWCGDSICDATIGENCTNCPEDCGHCCEQLCSAFAIFPPGHPSYKECCEGLTTSFIYDMDCYRTTNDCDVCASVGSECCTKCGDGLCQSCENYCNCPEDCAMNITNCSALPKLDTDVSWNIPDKILILTWQTAAGNQLLNTNVLAADKVQGQRNLSNFTLIGQGISGNSWQERVDERLKFFKVIAKVKLGIGACKPECWQYYQGVHREGWYDPCTEEFLKEDLCVIGDEPQCCFAPSKSEGWYNVRCDLAKPSDNLITYAQCEEGEYAIACNQSSDIFVKYTQPLIYNEPKRYGETPQTSINWFLFLPIEGIHSTKDFLLSTVPIDYIARWNVMRQDQQGSARGWFNRGKGIYGIYEEDHRYETQSEQGNNYMTGAAIMQDTAYSNQYQGGYITPGDSVTQGPPEYTVTGIFPLTDNSPYFVAATMDFDDFTWVGELPERVSYNLYGNQDGMANYIALPLDTRLAKAVDLCIALGLGLGNDETSVVAAWDPIEQYYLLGTFSQCKFIRDFPEDQLNFNLQAGTIYYVGGLTSNITWVQE